MPIHSCCSLSHYIPSLTPILLSLSYPQLQLSHAPAQTSQKTPLTFGSTLIAFVVDMSGNNNNNNNNKNGTDPIAHDQVWDYVALTPRIATFDPRPPEGIVIGQGPGWTNFDLEAEAPPPKKRSWLHVKVVIGVAVVAIVVVGVTVPMVIGIRNAGGKGIS